MKAYSMDLRERVLADCDAGLPTKAVADKYRVSTAWVRRLKQRRGRTGRSHPAPVPRGPSDPWTRTPTGSANWPGTTPT
jgi:transposase